MRGDGVNGSQAILQQQLVQAAAGEKAQATAPSKPPSLVKVTPRADAAVDSFERSGPVRQFPPLQDARLDQVTLLPKIQDLMDQQGRRMVGKVDNAVYTRLNKWLPAVLRGETEIPWQDAQAMKDLDTLKTAFEPKKLTFGAGKDGGNVSTAAADLAALAPNSQEDRLAFLQELRQKYPEAIDPGDSPGEATVAMSPRALEATIHYGETQGVLDAKTADAISQQASEAMQGGALSPEAFGQLVSARLKNPVANEDMLASAYFYINRAPDPGGQQYRLEQVLKSLHVLDTVGSAPSTFMSRKAVLDDFDPGIWEQTGSGEDKFRKVAPYLGLPGHHQVKFSSKRKLHLVNDVDGNLAGVQLEVKQSKWKKVLGVVLNVMSFIPIPVVAAIGRIGSAVMGAYNAAKNGDWLGAVASAAGGFMGGAGNLASKTATTAVKVASWAKTAQQGYNAYKAAKQGDWTGAVASAAGAFSGAIGKGATATSSGLQRFADWANKAGAGLKAYGAIKRGDYLAAAQYGAGLGQDFTQHGSEAYEMLGKIEGAAYTARVADVLIDQKNYAGAASILAGYGSAMTGDAMKEALDQGNDKALELKELMDGLRTTSQAFGVLHDLKNDDYVSAVEGGAGLASDLGIVDRATAEKVVELFKDAARARSGVDAAKNGTYAETARRAALYATHLESTDPAIRRKAVTALTLAARALSVIDAAKKEDYEAVLNGGAQLIDVLENADPAARIKLADAALSFFEGQTIAKEKGLTSTAAIQGAATLLQQIDGAHKLAVDGNVSEALARLTVNAVQGSPQAIAGFDAALKADQWDKAFRATAKDTLYQASAAAGSGDYGDEDFAWVSARQPVEESDENPVWSTEETGLGDYGDEDLSPYGVSGGPDPVDPHWAPYDRRLKGSLFLYAEKLDALQRAQQAYGDQSTGIGILDFVKEFFGQVMPTNDGLEAIDTAATYSAFEVVTKIETQRMFRDLSVLAERSGLTLSDTQLETAFEDLSVELAQGLSQGLSPEAAVARALREAGWSTGLSGLEASLGAPRPEAVSAAGP